MGDWSIGTNATCTIDGFKIRYCKKSGCDYSETDPIVAAGHSWVAATCTVPKTCSVCDATDGTTIPHVYDQEIEDPKYLSNEATCTEQAVYYMSCECGAAGTETFTDGVALLVIWYLWRSRPFLPRAMKKLPFLLCRRNNLGTRTAGSGIYT